MDSCCSGWAAGNVCSTHCVYTQLGLDYQAVEQLSLLWGPAGVTGTRKGCWCTSNRPCLPGASLRQVVFVATLRPATLTPPSQARWPTRHVGMLCAGKAVQLSQCRGTQKKANCHYKPSEVSILLCTRPPIFTFAPWRCSWLLCCSSCARAAALRIAGLETRFCGFVLPEVKHFADVDALIRPRLLDPLARCVGAPGCCSRFL